jgi:hypothetical protein
VPKISPVEASRRYLEHLRNAWNWVRPDAPFDAQNILVTVPASFDAVARELTLRAAGDAGYANVVLLEEPQAAFYAWIERHPDWARSRVGDLILVVDIGGGTTDLPHRRHRARRRASTERTPSANTSSSAAITGPALARFVEQQLRGGRKIDSFQLHALWQNCRLAKSVCSKTGTRRRTPRPFSARLGAGWRNHQGGSPPGDMERILLDGFFLQTSITICRSGAAPVARTRPAVRRRHRDTRHLARFSASRPHPPSTAQCVAARAASLARRTFSSTRRAARRACPGTSAFHAERLA